VVELTVRNPIGLTYVSVDVERSPPAATPARAMDHSRFGFTQVRGRSGRAYKLWLHGHLESHPGGPTTCLPTAAQVRELIGVGEREVSRTGDAWRGPPAAIPVVDDEDVSQDMHRQLTIATGELLEFHGSSGAI
jgi:hypothetical protein